MQPKNLLSQQIKQGVLYLNIGFLLLIFIAGIMYILGVSDSANLGYSFTQQELQRNELQNINESLKLEILKISSYSHITNNPILFQKMEKASPEFYSTRLDRLSQK